MLGKLVQILGTPLGEGFEVVYGVDFCKFGIADFTFARMELYKNPSQNNYKVTYCWEFGETNRHDGFIDFFVNNCYEPKKEDVEQVLWVVIPYSSEIKTTSKQIAGRYPEEAILEMKAGDTVEVCKGNAIPEVYVAVQVDNELFLIKKTR